jgi:hypothetical protein
MDTRPVLEIEATTEETGKLVPLAPRWLAWIIAFLSPPPGDATTENLIVSSLWAVHQSVRKVLVRLPLALVKIIYFHAAEAFYWKTALLQACILLTFFADILSTPVIVIMALTLSFLLIRDGYYKPEDMLECNLLVLFLAPEALGILAIGSGWVLPMYGWGLDWNVPVVTILQRVEVIGILIALCRHIYTRKVGPEHEYKAVMDAHSAAWGFTCIWFAGWLTYLISGDQIATPAPLIQGPLTVAPAMMLFTTSIRMQVNKLGRNYRYCPVETTLTTDPILDELMMKQQYLLVGAKWLCWPPTVQAILEMAAFGVAAMPVVIPMARLYMGSAFGMDWVQMIGHAIAYIVLSAVWFQVRTVHRRTRKLFDAAIADRKAKVASGSAG